VSDEIRFECSTGEVVLLGSPADENDERGAYVVATLMWAEAVAEFRGICRVERALNRLADAGEIERVGNCFRARRRIGRPEDPASVAGRVRAFLAANRRATPKGIAVALGLFPHGYRAVRSALEHGRKVGWAVSIGRGIVGAA